MRHQPSTGAVGRAGGRILRRSVVVVVLVMLSSGVAILVHPPVASADTIVILSGVLTDASGNPVAGADVYVTSNDSNASAFAVSAADGSYLFQLVPDSYSFEADATVDGLDQSVLISNLTISTSVVENFSFAPVGTVTAHVVDSNGNPFPGAGVGTNHVSPVDANTQDGTPYEVTGSPSVSGVTDSDGDAIITGLIGGPFNIIAGTRSGLRASGSGTPTADGNTVTLQFPVPVPTFTLSGVLTDSSGNPVAGATVNADTNTSGVDGSAISGADGSYSMTLPADSYSFQAEATVDGVDQTVAISDLTISTSVVENFSFGAVGTVTVQVVDSNGNPFPGAGVGTNHVSPVDANTQDGTPYEVTGSPSVSGVTDSNGDAIITGLIGGPFDIIAGTRSGLRTSGSGTPTAAGTTVTLQLPPPVITVPTFTLSGVLTDSAGNPVAGANVSAGSNNPNSTAPDFGTSSGADGSYSMTLPADSYSFSAEAIVDGLDQTVTISDLAISGDLVENLSFAAIGTATVNVVDANDNPVSDARIRLAGGTPASADTQDGTPYQITAFPSPGYCSTSSDGSCTFTGILGAVGILAVTPPGGLTTTGSMVSASPAGNTVTIQLADYATVESQGSTPGAVSISSPQGTQLTNISNSVATTEGLPVGSVAVTGALSYDVDVTPGASASVVLNLPPGSDPTDIFKYQNGEYVDVTSLATISGDTITLNLTDGGLGDADGIVNGVIVDPLVPVHITPQAQSVTFSSVAPSDATVLGQYTPSATSTSGLPAVITLDTASTGCDLASGIVSFTGVGTCIVDANQAGDSSYSAATQVQQSINVGKASQTLRFLSTLTKATVGATYRPSAAASSGLSVVIKLDATSKGCTLKGGLVSFSALGTCVLDANQSGNTEFGSALQVQQRIAVVEISITTTSLSTGKVGATYSATLKAAGGNPPYSWSLATGSKLLPPGLKLSSAGVISGKPTKKGTYSFTVKVVDTKTKTKPVTQHTATETLLITIS